MKKYIFANSLFIFTFYFFKGWGEMGDAIFSVLVLLARHFFPFASNFQLLSQQRVAFMQHDEL